MSGLTPKGILAMVAAFGLQALAFGAVQQYMKSSEPVPKQSRYEDVNGDGIEDKVIQKESHAVSFPHPIDSVLQRVHKEQILYGVGDVDGKPVYLPKDLFDQYRK